MRGITSGLTAPHSRAHSRARTAGHAATPPGTARTQRVPVHMPVERSSKRRATRHGLADAGAAADADQLAAAAAAGRARRAAGLRRPTLPAAITGTTAPQVAGSERNTDGDEPDATTGDTGTAYHIEMLNDSHRNTAFATAVRCAVKAAQEARGAPPAVLEIGAGGAALLSMVASAAGAGRCIAVECDTELAESARSVLAANSSSAVVAAIHSAQLRRDGAEVSDEGQPADVTLPAAGVDVLVSELFDDRLLGEQVLPTMRHALTSLAAPQRLVVPARAAIYAVLVQSDTIAMMSAPSAVPGVVTAPVNDTIEPMRVGGLQDLQLVSAPWEALTFNLGDLSQPLGGHRTVDVPVLAPVAGAATTGVGAAGCDSDTAAAGPGLRIDAVMFWWRATLWEGNGGAEGGGGEDDDPPVVLSSADPDSHWTPCIFPLVDEGDDGAANGAVIVPKEQQYLRVTAWHDEENVEFTVRDAECTEAAERTVNTDRAELVSEDEDEGEQDDEEEENDDDVGNEEHADAGGAQDSEQSQGKAEEEEDDDESKVKSGDQDSEVDNSAAAASAECCGDSTEWAGPPPIDRTRRWMLADPSRTEAISTAVEQTVRAAISSSSASSNTAPNSVPGRPPHVVCVGGGSGLCARAALLSDEANAGAVAVTAVEWTAEHADAVREAATAAECSDDVASSPQRPTRCLQVVDGASELKETLQRVLQPASLSSGGASEKDKEEGEQGAEVVALVAEPYFVALDSGRTWAKGHALLWWWSVHTARQAAGLVAPSVRVWPALGRLRGLLVSFKRLWTATRPVPHPRAAASDKQTAKCVVRSLSSAPSFPWPAAVVPL